MSKSVDSGDNALRGVGQLAKKGAEFLTPGIICSGRKLLELVQGCFHSGLSPPCYALSKDLGMFWGVSCRILEIVFPGEIMERRHRMRRQ